MTAMPSSEDYQKVQAAAEACGAPERAACRFYATNVIWRQGSVSYPSVERAYAAVEAASTPATARALLERLNALAGAGGLFWPFPPLRGITPFPEPMPDRIEDDDPDGVLPEQPPELE